MSARILHLPIPSAAEPSFPWGMPPAPSPDLRSQQLPPASIAEARTLRDALAGLNHRERAAAADFLVALADFDQRRGWEALGYKSLFAFLSGELHLSDGATFVRVSAARLIARFPAVEVALREGHLCLSTAGVLAGFLKPENQVEQLPRFFGLSARQAKELVATLAPRENPPRREILSRLPQNPLRTSEVERPERGVGLDLEVPGEAVEGCSGSAVSIIATATATATATPAAPSTIEPLSANLHRLHLTVSSSLVKKLAAAKDGLAHAIPGATTEQVLEAALDLLLQKQASRRGLVRRPRTPASVPATTPASTAAGAPASSAAGEGAGAPAGTASATAAGAPNGPSAKHLAAPPATAAKEPTTGSPPGQPTARPRYIPAAIRREVWLRDGQRCQHPLDSGGTCGATARLELDHLVPLALGGPSTAGNLRVVCGFHNRAAARAILGDALVEDRRLRGRQGRVGQAS